jgi:hypothetical protein
MQTILMFFSFWITSSAAYAGPGDIPHGEVDTLFSAIVCEKSATAASSFFDRRAYELSFWEDCAGLSSEHRTESEVIKLLLDLTRGGAPNGRGACTAQGLRQADLLKYVTRAGAHIGEDRAREAAIRKLAPAQSYATTLAVLRVSDDAEVSLVVVWARTMAKWRVASIDMVCV